MKELFEQLKSHEKLSDLLKSKQVKIVNTELNLLVFKLPLKRKIAEIGGHEKLKEILTQVLDEIAGNSGLFKVEVIPKKSLVGITFDDFAAQDKFYDLSAKRTDLELELLKTKKAKRTDLELELLKTRKAIKALFKIFSRFGYSGDKDLYY